MRGRGGMRGRGVMTNSLIVEEVSLECLSSLTLVSLVCSLVLTAVIVALV